MKKYNNTDIYISNSLIVFNSSEALGNLTGSNIEITNSIFVYTGSSTGMLYANAPATFDIQDSVFFATAGTAGVSSQISAGRTYNGFYYSNATGGISGWNPSGNSVSYASSNLNTLIGYVGFLA